MEYIETTPETAKEIIASGNRQITIDNEDARTVKSINLNNRTCFAEKDHSGSTYNLEDVTLLINVPSSSKTVF